MQTKINERSLPTGWQWVKLGDVCEFLDSRRKPINETERTKRIQGKKENELYPYYGANGQVGWIDDYLFDEPLILLAEDGGFFGSKDRPIAYSASGKYWVNNHAHVLRPRTEIIDFDFCLHSLRIRPDIGKMVAGATRAKLNQETALSIPITLPPLDEQRRIASRLNEQLAAVESARAATEEQLQAARELPSAYLREVFEGEEAKKWHKQRLAEVSEIVSGLTLGRKLDGVETRKVPYLRVANVKDGYLDLSDVKEISATEADVEKCTLKYGDLLLTEGGDPDKLGRGTFWEEQIPECLHQNHIFRVRFDLGKFFPQFIAYQVGSSYGKAYFLAHAKQTTGIATINQKVLGNFPILIPSFDEQKRIAETLNSKIADAERLVASLESQIAEIERLPASLLREAFAG